MESLGTINSVQTSFSEYTTNVELKTVETVDTSNNETRKGDVSPEVEKGLHELNGFLETRNAKAIISNHEVFGDTMIKIIDQKTNEVLLETPPEKILDMIAKLCEIVGLKLDKKA